MTQSTSVTNKKVPPTLLKLYEDEPSLEKKAWKFLEDYYTNGSSFTALAKIHDCHWKTTERIFNYIEDHLEPVYLKFKGVVHESVSDFTGKTARQRLYGMIQDEINEIETTIRRAKREHDNNEVYRYRQLKKDYLKTQLVESVKMLTKHEAANDTPSETPDFSNDEYERAAKEALEEKKDSQEEITH